MKKQLLFAVLSLLMGSTSIFAQSNPVAEFYAEGYPAWTDQILWSNEINMATDARITAITGQWARYEKGIELLGTSGGVLYYPAGTYVFSDIPAGADGAAPQGEGIMLRSGVVIKGEKPTKQIASAVTGGVITLTTKFEFPLYNRLVRTTGVDSTDVKQLPGFWNFVGLKARVGQTVKDVNNIGICFVQFKYGGVYWGAEYAWAASYSDPTAKAYGNSGVEAKNGWMKTRVADGTHYQDPFGGCAALTIGTDVGTDYKGAGSGRLILACRFDESVLMDAGGYFQASKKNGLTNLNQTFKGLAIDSYRFAGRITVDAKNIFIASSSITKPVVLPFIFKTWLFLPASAPYITQMQNRAYPLPVLFDPAKQIGIDVCKSVTGLINVQQRAELREGAPFYEPNITVRDNYVYNHGNKGIEVTGSWVKVLNNVNDRNFLSNGLPAKDRDWSEGGSPNTIAVLAQEGDGDVYGITTAIPYQSPCDNTTTPPALLNVVTVPGHYCGRMSSWSAVREIDDNMARAFDMGGQNVWIDGNRYWETGSATGNDGEGILCQRSGQIEAISWAITNNKILEKGFYSKSGYVGLYDVNVVGALILNNGSEVSYFTAGVNKPVANWVGELAILNNKNPFDGNADSSPSGGSNLHAPIYLTVDYPASPVILAPTGVKTTSGAGYTEISWDPDYTINGATATDNSQEIGYRVERRVGIGSWTVVAYRPMQSGQKPLSLTGLKALTYNGATSWTTAVFDPNPPMWRDYEKPATGTYEYRVVALGSTEGQNKVQGGLTTAVKDLCNENEWVSVYPNPTHDRLVFSQLANKVSLFNLYGSVVLSAVNVNQLSLQELPSGIYTLKMQIGTANFRIKVMKK